VLSASGVEVGEILLRVDQWPSVIDLAGHIAYEIHPQHRGRGYAARACAIVRPLARVHLEVAWIMTAPDNLASIRTAERIGAEYVDTREVPENSDIRALGVARVRRYRWVL
jgi:predicted acetyltransferase